MTVSAFLRWERELESLERECPWPGPRPLGPQDEERSLLAGRHDDIERFRRAIDQHRLVVLTGESGVGKTSLLNAGLCKALEDAGYTVALCDDWSNTSSDVRPVPFLAEKLRTALARADERAERPVREWPAGPAIFGAVSMSLGRNLVFVLDQFEELIRYADWLTDRTLALLVELNKATPMKIVVSLRSEYEHQLKPLYDGAKPFTTTHFALGPLKDEYALDVVLAANKVRSEVVIDHELAELIVDRWRAAKAEAAANPEADPFGRVGLLHLQALMYALDELGRAGHGVRDVTLRQYDSWVSRSLAEAGATATARSTFTMALQRAISIKLTRCREASAGLADDYLVDGVESLIAKAAQHLSSAGYKLVRESRELADAVLGVELSNLQRGAGVTLPEAGPVPTAQRDQLLQFLVSAMLRESAAATDQDAIDLLSMSVPHIATAVDARSAVQGELAPDSLSTRLERVGRSELPDRAEVTCGPMAGFPAEAVMIEEARRFAFALAWLERAALVRISTPGNTGTMVSLIHDGFGRALQQWAATMADSPNYALSALTAPQGASYLWINFECPGEPLPQFDGTGGHRVYANLRWKGAWVKAKFRNVAFVNCDFRGTMWQECGFEGVTFVNCLLDGGMFSECDFVGVPELGANETDWSTSPPVFEIDDPGHRFTTAARRYRDRPGATRSIYSQRPGFPAVTIDERDPGDDPIRPHTLAHGGVAVYGGRVSTLVLRNCTFHGTLALRHVAGSGLDLVEQNGACSVELRGCALRHFTITAADGAAGRDGGETLIDIEIVGCALAQPWFGPHLQGKVRIFDSTILQMWNLSPASSGGITVDIDGGSEPQGSTRRSKLHGLVGVEGEFIDASWVGGGRSVSALDDFPPEVIGAAGAMDYQRNPALSYERARSSHREAT